MCVPSRGGGYWGTWTGLYPSSWSVCGVILPVPAASTCSGLIYGSVFPHAQGVVRKWGHFSSAHPWQRTHRWSHCCDRAEDVAQYYKFQWVYEGYHWLRSLVGTDLQHRLDLPFYSRKQYQGNIKAHQQLDALVLAEQWRLSAKHYWLLVVFYPQK